MNEIETMRDALDRTERNLERFRWVLTHPHEARDALTIACRATVDGEGVPLESVVFEIDRARGKRHGGRV